jgi:CTP synthase
LTESAREKIALYCNVDKHCVIEEVDVEHTIYEVPLDLIRQNIDEIIADRFNALMPSPNMSEWARVVDAIIHPKRTVRIAMVGKYIEHQDAYKSIIESFTHAGVAHQAAVEVIRIESAQIERDGVEKYLNGVDGILVPGGFGKRGTEGKIMAIRYARENNIPFFGICLGMQLAAVEFARNVCGLADAHSFEFDEATTNPVIALLDDQMKVTKMGGTMRLGARRCVLDDGSLAQRIYGKPEISERHRHRYEFNNAYRKTFTDAGMALSGISPDDSLVEIIELKSHPFFIGVQFHPEFKSTPVNSHPIFRAFVGAALERQGETRLIKDL